MRLRNRLALLLAVIVPVALSHVGFSAWLNTDKTVVNSNNKSDENICYINTTTNGYPSIELALDAADGKDGDTVYVIPGDVNTIYTISEDCEIKSGVTLTLPYDSNNNYDSGETGEIQSYTGLSDSKPETYRKIQVLVNNGVTITVNGTLNIGGVHGGTAPQSATKGDYAEMVMYGSSKLEVNGTINCFGFIKEVAVGDNKPNIFAKAGSNIKTMITVYDWTDGMDALNKYRAGVFVTNQFDFPNIRVRTTYYYNSIFSGVGHIWGSSLGHQVIVRNIVATSDSLVILHTLNSYVILDFDDLSSTTVTTTTFSQHKFYIEAHGNCSIEKLVLSVKVGISVTIDSSNFYLPIPSTYEIVSYDTFSTPYKIKFMDGSKFHVKPGATGTIGESIVFYDKNSFTNEGMVTFNKGLGGFVNASSSLSSPASLIAGTSFSSVKDCHEYGETATEIIPKLYLNSVNNEARITQNTIYTSNGSYWTISNKYRINFWSNTGEKIDGLDPYVGDASSITLPGSDDVSNLVAWTRTKNSVNRDYLESSNFNFEDNRSHFYLANGERVLDLYAVLEETTAEESTLTISYSNGFNNKDAWEVNVKINDGDTSTLSGTGSDKVETFDAYIGDSVTFTVVKGVEGVTFNGFSGDTTYVSGKTDYSLTITKDPCSITITGSGSCLIPSTLITLADGSQKQVKDIVAGDELLVMNHETGMLDTSPVVFNDKEEYGWYDVTYLRFSNGEEIGISYEHGFFDRTLNEYVYITNSNGEDFIGHTFYTENGDITLTSVETVREYTELYSPVTAWHLNYFTNGVLSMPGGIEGLFNIFEYEEDSLKYDEFLMQQDIEQYGLFTYEDFKDYVPYEFYAAFPAPYLKVSIGKGYITFEEVLRLIERYAKLV